MLGLKKRSHTQNSHPKVVNPRDIAGERKKKKKKKIVFAEPAHSLNFLCSHVKIHVENVENGVQKVKQFCSRCAYVLLIWMEMNQHGITIFPSYVL